MLIECLRKYPGSSLRLEPEKINPDLNHGEVLIQVAYVGVCRTDLLVIQDKLPIEQPLILGHEFSGIVVHAATESHFTSNTPVTVNPLQNGKFMGLHLDGCLAHLVKVKEEYVHPIPSRLSLQQAAYTEPVAASMAVLKALPRTRPTIGIIGDNRIAALTRLILETEGFHSEPFQPRPDHYDVVVETAPVRGEVVVDSLKTNGTFIIKSRTFDTVTLPLKEIVRKEIAIKGVNYSPFEQALKWLSEHGSKLDHLFGQTFRLHDYQKALDVAQNGESKKVFISLME